MENGHARKAENGRALVQPPQESGAPWQSAALRVEEVLGGIIEALIGPAMKGSLPHARFLIEFAQAAKEETPSSAGGGEIAKLLDDLLRDDPQNGPENGPAE